MRGTDQQQNHVFSYISPEQRVPRDHPLRPIRTMVDEILKQLSPRFNNMYAKVGRPSIPPEQLLRAQLLQIAVLGAQRAVTDGRDGLQNIIPLSTRKTSQPLISSIPVVGGLYHRYIRVAA